MISRINAVFFILLAFSYGFSCATLAEESAARLFSDRCVLCHGKQGMGEGPLPMSLKNYPSTNLLHNVIRQSRKDVLDTITNGSTRTSFMPPWKGELSHNQISLLADFVMTLRNHPADAMRQLKSLEDAKQKNLSDGKHVYETRCVLCHGLTGLGDGRMSRVVKNPPPFNLRKSVMPPLYLKNIITRGGEAMSRSVQMPPWGDQLSEKEIEAVIKYIVSLRN